ncbi:MAG: PAS domain S-box protein [Gammaproteobacteria bacterium]
MLIEFIKIFSMVVVLLMMAAAGQFYFSMTPVPVWLYVYMLFLLTGCSMMLAYVMIRCGRAESQVMFERRFRKILENIDLLSIGLDNSFKITFCNDALLALTSWQRKDVLDRDWFEIFVPVDAQEQSRMTINRIFAPDYTSSLYEDVIRSRNGQRFLIEWNVSKMFDPLGQPIGITLIGKNITDERQSEDQLRKLSRAVEQSPSVVIITDINGNIEYVNPKFTHLTGYTFEEVRGKNPRLLKSGETGSEEYRKLWNTITAGGTWNGVFHNRKKNGEYYWEMTSISPIRDNDGNIVRYLAVKEDITERRRLEEEVQQRNREIAKNQALAVTGRMATMIAHDLRNPLSSIKMGLQILGNRESSEWNEDDYELKQIALGQIGYMEAIMEDLLSYSRPDALTPEWLKLDELLDKVLIHNQKEINKHGAEIVKHYRSGLPNLHGDTRKLQQVFTNLIMNALQATEGLTDRAPRITISTSLEVTGDRPGICIEIGDNGCGMKTEELENILEPFYTTRAKGTGLGLAIVKHIVEQHHGMLSVDTHQGDGTCIKVLLPTGPLDYSESIQSNNKETNCASGHSG